MNKNHHSICMKDEVTAFLSGGGYIQLIGETDSEYKNSFSCDDAVSIALTSFKIAVLRQDGTVFTRWYQDYYMDYYDAETDSFLDVYYTDDWSGITKLCAGNDHIVGLTSGGRVCATGNNDKGQCNVSGWTNIVDIAAGGDTTLGLRADGTVVVTGDDKFDICKAKMWKNIKRIFAGDYDAVGIKNDGTFVSTNEDWEQELNEWTDIVNISVGCDTVIGVKSSGRVYAISEDADFKEKLEQWTNIVDAAVTDDLSDHYAVGLRSNGKLVSLGSGFWDDTILGDKRINIDGRENIKTPDGTKARDDRSDYAFSSSNTSGFKVEDIFYTVIGFIIVMIMFGSCNQ